MARVNITMPDELYREAKRAGLNISQLARQAVAAELVRRAKVAELDAYLAELEAELGPTTAAERAEADAWATRVLGPDERQADRRPPVDAGPPRPRPRRRSA